MNKVLQGDCLELMKDIPDKSIDMILCDLPYSIKDRNRVTGNKWDLPIDIEPLWEQYKRIIKDDGCIALTASQPFASYLVNSNIDMFKYDWIWEKDNGTNFTSVNYQPFRSHESIIIFSKGATTFTKQGGYMKYNPQKTVGKPYTCKSGRKTDNLQGGDTSGWVTENDGSRHPKTVQKFNRDKNKLHPTQKPVALFEYLIKTYTNEGDLVLDNCAGSGTTGVACKNLNRQYVLMEKEQEYIDIINKRLTQDTNPKE